MRFFIPDMNYLHRNNTVDSSAEQRIREIRITTNYPGADGRVQSTFIVFFNIPALTETLGGHFFEGQQHSSDHDRHKHIVPAVKHVCKSMNLTGMELA